WRAYVVGTSPQPDLDTIRNFWKWRSSSFVLPKAQRALLRDVLGQKKNEESPEDSLQQAALDLDEVRAAFKEEDQGEHWSEGDASSDPAVPLSFSLVVLAQVYERYAGSKVEVAPSRGSSIASSRSGGTRTPRRDWLYQLLDSTDTDTTDQRLLPVFWKLFGSVNDAKLGNLETSFEFLDPRHRHGTEVSTGQTNNKKRCFFFRLQQQVRNTAKAELPFDTFAADPSENYAVASRCRHSHEMRLLSHPPAEWMSVSPGLELANRLYAVTALDVLAFPVQEQAFAPSTISTGHHARGRGLPSNGDYLLIYAIQQRAVGDSTTYVWRGRSAKEIQDQGFIMKTERLRDLPRGDYHCEIFHIFDEAGEQVPGNPCPAFSDDSEQAAFALRTDFEFLPERLLHL
ncbi:unnamed protein product, partial [Amoebophrya sp. A25]